MPLFDLVPLLDQIHGGARSADSLEGQTLDFKTEKPTLKETYQDLADAAVCFANAEGGLIVVGVADRGAGDEAFPGTRLDPDAVKSRVHALTEPHLFVNAEHREYRGKQLLVMAVAPGSEVFSTSKGYVTRRWMKDCLPMRPADVSRLDDERRGVDWSAQPSGRPVAEVDGEAIGRARALLRRSPRDSVQKLATLPDADLLRALGLISDDGHLNRAGEVLFCERTAGGAPQLLFYQYRATVGGEAAASRRWSTPLVSAFFEAMEVVGVRIGVTPVTTAAGQQLQIEDYPLLAVREALANALLHGDHREGRPVLVEHSPEQLTVRSPGPLVSGITPENILTKGTKARFRALANAFTQLGMAEELGQGVDRMFREMIRSGRRVPRVEEQDLTSEASTLVTFVGGPPNGRVSRFINELPEAERDDTDALLTVYYLCEKRTVNAKDLSLVLQREVAPTEAILRRLSTGEAELLEPTVGTARRTFPNYRLRSHALAALGPAVSYQRTAASEMDQKIVAHVREYDTVNSATVQRLFDVDVYRARDILRDLVGREVITRVSEQRRGPAVKYGPGANFPAKKSRHKKQ